MYIIYKSVFIKLTNHTSSSLSHSLHLRGKVLKSVCEAIEVCVCVCIVVSLAVTLSSSLLMATVPQTVTCLCLVIK